MQSITRYFKIVLSGKLWKGRRRDESRNKSSKKKIVNAIILRQNGNSQFRGPLFVIKPFFATRRRRRKRDLGALFSVKRWVTVTI